MKRFLIALFAIAALYTTARAASTDTLEGTMNSLAVDISSAVAESMITFVVTPEPEVPVEQKVVEIHMTSNLSFEMDQSRKRRRKEKLPFDGGMCSGSFINSNGDVLTAKHCVDGFSAFEVQTFDRRTYAATVVATSTIHDLAVLHIDRRNTPFFQLAESETRGEQIFILGSPLAITDVMSTGVIAKLDGDRTLLDCGALPGNSGGPVFNRQHELVGVLTAGFIVLFGTTHLNMAQSLDAVIGFLEKANVKRGE